MYGVGWVHRDVSCANLLLWRDAEGELQGKLGDLETAKPFPSARPLSIGPMMVRPVLRWCWGVNASLRDALIQGTPLFMPIEIALGNYMADEKAVRERKTASDILKELKELGANFAKGKVASAAWTPVPSEPVQHNFLHDVESLFWLTLWAITYRTGHFHLVLNAFVPAVNNLVTIMRKEWLSSPHFLERALGELPPSIGAVKGLLRVARDVIYRRYIELSSSDLREDPAEHSLQYELMYLLVMVAMPDGAPSLVKVDSQEVEDARHSFQPCSTTTIRANVLAKMHILSS